MSPDIAKKLNALLPAYQGERWELQTLRMKKTGQTETILFFPQSFLDKNGKRFEVRGSFTR